MKERKGQAAVAGNQRLAILSADADAELVMEILHGAGISGVAVTAGQLIESIGSGDCAAAIIAAEILSAEDVLGLEEALKEQPPWSDFPFVLIAGRERLDEALHLLPALGHAAIVERPIHPPLLINEVQAALRSRARQHESEAYLLQRQSAEEHLRQLTSTLETRVGERMGEIRAANERLVREIDERRAAEERLRESEELYRYTVELSQQLAWTATPDGTIVSISPRFHSITGLDKSIPPHEGWLQAVHPDDVAGILHRWEWALGAMVPHVAEFRMRTADGSYRLFRARAAPRFSEDGRVLRWYGYTEDIEDQMRAEAARLEAENLLRDSEELHRYTLELTQQIAWTADADGRFRTISPNFSKVTGLPAGPQRDAMHPEDVDRVLTSWADAVASGEPHVSEFRMRVRDGSYRTFRGRVAPRRDASGRIVQWFGTSEDIHDWKLSELARLEAEERYRLAARATNDAIWDLDFTTGQILWNESDGLIFGYAVAGQSTGLDWWEERLHPDERDRVASSLEAAIAAGGSRWSAAYRFLTAAGDYADIFDRGFFIRDQQGQVVRVVGAMMDVTARRRAEAELRRVQAELIQVSRLSAMGTMASTLAHELNQPLTTVANYVRGSRRLLEGVDDPVMPEVRQALEAAETGSLRAGQVLRSLRELVFRGSVVARIEELPKLVQDASLIGFVDEHLFSAHHNATFDPAANWVKVDAIQIQQVLINLIRNALQAVQDQPRREVTIRTSAVSEAFVEVSVADTGSGIPAGVRGALFSPFRSTKQDGMGIGLSISRTIVEAHGGKIWAEDGDEGGAVFRFTLPRAEAPKEQAGAPS